LLFAQERQGRACGGVAKRRGGIFLVPYRLPDNAGSVGKLMKKYADVPMDFADACLVDMATMYQTGRILTVNSDFRFYRWGKNRTFELLLSPERS
jgi:hypothetical protein